jgi:agmatine deiminase
MATPPLNPRLPAEWEPHEATWLVWPSNPRDWPGKFAPIPWVWAEIVRHLSMSEPVHVLVPSERSVRTIGRLLGKAGADLSAVTVHPEPTNRAWARDTFPAFIHHGSQGPQRKTAMVEFRFNAWAKYPDHGHDRSIPERIERLTGLTRYTAQHKGRPVVLEGGAIDSDGRGTLLTTEECLLDQEVQTRNPGFTRADYEQVFREMLGIEAVIWLPGGILGDDTHGHVDDVCRFVAQDTVVLCREDNPGDGNRRLLEANREVLGSARTARGSKVQVIDLPMPAPLFFQGQRLPASYANFYIANSCVLVPTFNDANDRLALSILADCFPGRTVKGIHAVDLVWGFGTLHCLTHEQPA